MKATVDLIAEKILDNKIFVIRGRREMLDFHLAELYGVQNRVLLQAVKRNDSRFPDDFMFQLYEREFDILRSQSVTSSWGGRRYRPHAFTEQGVAMLSSVLRSERAVQVNTAIMRVFVKLREISSANRELAAKLKALHMKLEKHDEEIQGIFKAIAELMALPPEKPKNPIGFRRD